MIVALSDKRLVIITHQNLSAGNRFEPPLAPKMKNFLGNVNEGISYFSCYEDF